MNKNVVIRIVFIPQKWVESMQFRLKYPNGAFHRDACIVVPQLTHNLKKFLLELGASENLIFRNRKF